MMSSNCSHLSSASTGYKKPADELVTLNLNERNLTRAMDSKEEEEEKMEVYKSEDDCEQGEKDSDYICPSRRRFRR